LINQRQGGRRRGRGGQRGQNLGGQPGGNRQDNRQRGNAAQLLEKYKSLARDAQLSGDRVQSEYYLQFADHYFRVLGESRVRFEDQRRQRDDDEDEDMIAEGGEEGGEETADNEQRFERQERHERRDRAPRGDRGDRPRRYEREDRAAAPNTEVNGADRGSSDDERIAMDVLPPAIGRDDASNDEGADEAPARPRRRARRPRSSEGESEIAPAA
jgi:hypothetical protein